MNIFRIPLELILKRWYLVIISLGIITILLMQLQTTTTDQTTEPPATIDSNIGNVPFGVPVEYQGIVEDLPAEMAIYELQEAIDLTRSAQTMARNLNLPPHPEAPNLWQSQDYRYSISIIQPMNLVQYSVFDQNTDFPTGIDLGSARQVAHFFMQRIQRDILIDLDQPLLYFDSATEPTETSIYQARYIVFRTYYATPEGYPIYISDQSHEAMQVWVRSDNEVTKATFTPKPNLVQTQSRINSKLLNHYIDSISLGRATITALGPRSFDLDLTPRNIQAIRLLTMTPEYRIIPGNTRVYPYLNFSGEARTTNGLLREIEVTLPL